MELASRIAKEKKAKNLPIRNEEREEAVLDHVEEVGGEKTGKYIRNVYRKLIDETCLLEEECLDE